MPHPAVVGFSGSRACWYETPRRLGKTPPCADSCFRLPGAPPMFFASVGTAYRHR